MVPSRILYLLKLTMPLVLTTVFGCAQGGLKKNAEPGPGPLNVQLGPIEYEYERDFLSDRYYADLTVKNTSNEIIEGALFTSAVVSETLAGQVINDSFKGHSTTEDLRVRGAKGYFVGKPLIPEEERVKRFGIYSIPREVAKNYEWSSAQVQIYYTARVLGKEHEVGPFIVGIFTITKETKDKPK